MREIAGVIAIIITIILIFFSEEFRDITKIGLLVYIGYILTELYKAVK